MKTKKVLALLVLAAMIMSIVPAMAFGFISVYDSVVYPPSGSVAAQPNVADGPTGFNVNDVGAEFVVTLVQNGNSVWGNLYVASSRNNVDRFFYSDYNGNWIELLGARDVDNALTLIVDGAGQNIYTKDQGAVKELTIKVMSVSAGTSNIAFGTDKFVVTTPATATTPAIYSIDSTFEPTRNTAAYARSRSSYTGTIAPNVGDSVSVDTLYILKQTRYPAEFTSPRANGVTLNVRQEDMNRSEVYVQPQTTPPVLDYYAYTADGKYANGVDSYRIIAFVTTRAGIPVANENVNFSIYSGSGAFLSATRATTNASGNAEVRVYSTIPGEVLLRARVAGVSPSVVTKNDAGGTFHDDGDLYLDQTRVSFKPTGIVRLEGGSTGAKNARPRSGTGNLSLLFSCWDALDNRMDFEDIISKDKATRDNITNMRNGAGLVGPESFPNLYAKPTLVTFEVAIVKAPSGSPLKADDVSYSVNSDSGDLWLNIPWTKLIKDGDYEIKLYLINGNSILWTFSVKDLGDVVELTLNYGSNEYSAGTVLPEPSISQIDADGYKLTDLLSAYVPKVPLSISRTEFMDGQMEANTGKLKLHDNMTGQIEMTIVDRDLNMVASKVLTINKPASMLKLTPQVTVAPVGGQVTVDLELVDVDGKLAATGLKADMANNATRGAIVSPKREGEVSSVSRLNTSGFANGKSSVRVSSNLEGDVTIQVIIKEVVAARPGITIGGFIDTTEPRQLAQGTVKYFWDAATLAEANAAMKASVYKSGDTLTIPSGYPGPAVADGVQMSIALLLHNGLITATDTGYPAYVMERATAGAAWAAHEVQLVQYPSYKIGTLDDLSVGDKYGGRTYTGAATVSFGVSSGAGGTTVFIIGAPSFVSGNMAFVAESPAFIENGRTYLGVRDTATSIDATLEWDQDTQTATISKANISAKITVGAEEISVTKSGVTTTVAIDFPAVNKDGRVYMPIRALLQDVFGYTVTWNNDGQSIHCTL